ncbi:MAG: energy-coupling factor transporter transmembrane protein EcfT [Victivallales bacterium]|nr:energy-coupling factor transporter transmembrane protein EcfT [Victivallales bacterium]
MSKYGTLYIEGNSFFHRLAPSIKFIIFILWSITVFMSLDLRLSLALLAIGIIFLFFAEIPFRIIKNLFAVVIIFNIINAVFILLISPEFGAELTGQKTRLCSVLGFPVLMETLFYVITISLKYLSLLPMALILIFSTHPTRFASSLNKIGIPYKIAYTFNIIFRYIPEIQNEFKIISQAQAARGLSYGKDEKSLIKRMKNIFSITIPLLNTSLERIDKITNAMELREFGKYKKRSWYNESKISRKDLLVLIAAMFLFTAAVYHRLTLDSWFWYPFK